MAIQSWKTKTPGYIIAAWGFFLITVILTMGVFWYKMYMSKKVDTANDEIYQLRDDIGKMRQDKDIQAFELYDSNKKKLDTMIYLSQIPDFYKGINDIARKYGLVFSSFSYGKWIIWVQALSEDDSGEASYEKIAQLIADFKDDSSESKVSGSFTERFDLWFVRAFNGSEDITANLEFTVKPQKTKVSEAKDQEKAQEQEDTAQASWSDTSTWSSTTTQNTSKKTQEILESNLKELQ